MRLWHINPQGARARPPAWRGSSWCKNGSAARAAPAQIGRGQIAPAGWLGSKPRQFSAKAFFSPDGWRQGDRIVMQMETLQF